jgi:putative holliday junction resolvase
MSLLLAADIGRRRTGLAIGDTVAGFVMALQTLKHKEDSELIAGVLKIAQEKKVTELIIGLPLLPQGDEGEQSTYVRGIANELGKQSGLVVTLLDERYSTNTRDGTDPDARAACELASLAVQQRQKRH